MSIELKPCPFCGSKNLTKYNNGYYAFIVCENCGGNSKWFSIGNIPDYEEKAIDAWNRRATDEH